MGRRDTSVLAVALLLSLCIDAFAQLEIFETPSPNVGGVQAIVVGPDGKPMVVPGSAPVPSGGPPKPGTPMPGKQVPGTPKQKPNADANTKKPGKDGKANVLTRPEKPPSPADADELNATPDPDGFIQFSFRYQTWPDVLDWLASISNMSLDWQELPKDFLNLTTQRKYSLVETHDLINRHLLARGFTLLENGNGLSAVAIGKLNPAMVPRVQAEELDQLVVHQPYKFVKVSFALDWLLADQAATEFKPMLSTNGKLIPLTKTNRLEAMDAAINLRELHTLLKQEQSDSGESPLVNEFVLVHARATDVLAELETLLGLQAKKSATTSMPAGQMQMLQQQQQMAQQMAQQRRGTPAAAAKKESAVNLVVNKRKNSILAHAPPDKMAIIGQAIEALDVRPDRNDSLLAKPNQLEVYRLNNLDPTALAKTLNDLGDLQPSTYLEVDKENNALIVFGSLLDQATIRQLVQRLDGNSRHFEVVRLRRLAADYVAGTVEFMMVGKEEKKDEQPAYYDFYPGRFGGGGQSKTETKRDTFRVDADVQNNMLLLWANDLEIEAVMELLAKLGELPPQGSNPNKVRVLTTIAPEDAAEFLEQLRRAWPSLSPNPLQLPDLPKTEEAQPLDEDVEQSAPRATDKEVRASPRRSPASVLEVALLRDDDAVETSNDAGAAPKAPASRPATDQQPALPSTVPLTPAGETVPRAPQSPSELSAEDLLRRFLSRQGKTQNETPSPVNLSFAPDGSLVITSEDTAALDVLEELVRQTAPPLPDYKIYKLKYADAYWVMDNIEAFFKEDEEEEKMPLDRFYYYDFPPPQEPKTRSRLSQRRKLKFIYDLDTNSILVQGADAHQLKTIEELIEVYDQPEPSNSQSARVSKAFPIRYSKATIIAEAIKDVYRDLLSSNDKALQSNNNPERKNRESREATYIFGGTGDDEPDRTQVSFKGKLSIGIDEVSNTLLVSAAGENLMKIIGEMIETLDEAAQPLSSYSVVRLDGNTNAARVREVLSRLITKGQSDSNSPATTNSATTNSATTNPATTNPNATPRGPSPRGGSTPGDIQADQAISVSPLGS